MSGTGDARVEAAVRAALREQPRDVVELAAALRTAVPSLVRDREGSLHAILHAAVRTARLHVRGRSERGLALYALPGEDPRVVVVAPPERARPEPPPVSAAISRAALRAARDVRDPADRGRVVADVTAHLLDLDATGVARAFGPPRTAQLLLRRADRHRPFVAFPATVGDHLHRFVLHEGPWIVGAIAAFVLLKLFVLDVNVIPSSSMVPTLLEGDRVVVLKIGTPRVPERWRVHTFRKHGTTYVKRVVGLPGEKFAIVHGDAWADGRVLRKPDDVREALRGPYAVWEFGAGPPQGWTERRGADGSVRTAFTWYLPAHGLPEPKPPDGPWFELRDVYLDLDVERPAQGSVRLELGRAGGDPAAWAGEGAWTIHVRPEGVRVGGVDGAPAPGPAPAAGRTRVSLSYVDGVLRGSVGDFSFAKEVPAPDEPVRVAFRVADGTRALALRLDRDLHYSYQHTFAVPTEPYRAAPEDYGYSVPKDAVFCLGDNTLNSTDSRSPSLGPVKLDEVIGPVVFRMWPPARIGTVR